MDKSLRKVLWLWGVALLAFILAAVAASYFLTGYRVNLLKNTFQQQYQQLQKPIPEFTGLRKTTVTELPEVDVSSLLIQAAKQHNVELHYQQDPQHPQQWLAGVSGNYQSAIRFIVSILQTQKGLQQAFPVTETLQWQDIDQHKGKLSWQFLWLKADDPAVPEINTTPLFKSDFLPIAAVPVKCPGKPDMQSDIEISDWASVQLLATQTLPLKKALLSIPGQPLLELTEENWIAVPLMQLQSINQAYAEFRHWQKEGACWSSQPLKLHLTKDDNPQ